MGGYGWKGFHLGACGPQSKPLRAVLISVFILLAAAALVAGLYVYYKGKLTYFPGVTILWQLNYKLVKKSSAHSSILMNI